MSEGISRERRASAARWRAVLALSLALGPLGCGSNEAETGAPAAATKGAAEGPGAPLVVTLDEAALARAGIELASLEADQLAPEVLAYGRVLDPVPASAVLSNLAAARAAADAAERERVRVEGLARNGVNASAREVEAARATAARAQADLEQADYRVDALLGAARPTLGDLSELARGLGRRQVALVRVDVPGGRERPQPEHGARLTAYPETSRTLSARYLGPAPEADPRRPGWSFSFLVTEAPPPPGSPVWAHLAVTGEPVSGVHVPERALLRSEGRLFAFVALGGGRFERRVIEARVLPDGSAFATQGLSPGDSVVVSGAQQLLSSQRLAAGAGEEED